MKSLEIPAEKARLAEVIDFVIGFAEKLGFGKKELFQLRLCTEEIFVNIASYAYTPGKGSATVKMELQQDPPTARITFLDRGVPYNPMEKEDPDVTLPAEERDIGGLGILLTKKTMDDVAYEYRDGQNILTLKKKI